MTGPADVANAKGETIDRAIETLVGERSNTTLLLSRLHPLSDDDRTAAHMDGLQCRTDRHTTRKRLSSLRSVASLYHTCRCTLHIP